MGAAAAALVSNVGAMVELARMLLAGLGPLLTLVLPVAFLVGGIRLARSQEPLRGTAADRPPAWRVAAAEAVAASEIELPPPHEVELPQEVELSPAQELEPSPAACGRGSRDRVELARRPPRDRGARPA